jgi:hypothetical protein
MKPSTRPSRWTPGESQSLMSLPACVPWPACARGSGRETDWQSDDDEDDRRPMRFLGHHHCPEVRGHLGRQISGSRRPAQPETQLLERDLDSTSTPEILRSDSSDEQRGLPAWRQRERMTRNASSAVEPENLRPGCESLIRSGVQPTRMYVRADQPVRCTSKTGRRGRRISPVTCRDPVPQRRR